MGLQPAGHQVLLFGPRPYLQIMCLATIKYYTVFETTFANYVYTTVTQYFRRLLLFFPLAARELTIPLPQQSW